MGTYHYSLRRLSCLFVLLVCSIMVMQAIEVKPLRDRCVVKKKGEWYVLRTNLLTFQEYPELQKQITRTLFGSESTSIKNAYHNYVNGFEGIKSYRESSKAKGKMMSVSMRLVGKKSRYMSLVVEYTSTDLDGKTDKHLHLIFDETTQKVLADGEMVTRPYLEQYRQQAPGAFLQFHLDKTGFNVGYADNGKYTNRHIAYKDADDILTDSFKQLIMLDSLKKENAVSDSIKKNTQELADSLNVGENKVFDVVDVMPKFPGGNEMLMQFLEEQTRYPIKAEKKGIDGRVIVVFFVEKDGSVTNAKVVKSADPILDAAALRIIQKMPKWIPGKVKGIPVRAKYTIPFTFRIEETD